MPSILLIDDNKLLSLVEARYIQRAIANVDIVVSSNGCCTLELADTKKPDVTILDTGLLDISPMEVYESLCEIVEPKSILITSNDLSMEFEELKAEGNVFDVLIRPFSTSAIITAVEQILRNQGHEIVPYKSTFPPPTATALNRFDRHLALNQLSGLLGAIRAFEAEIEAEGDTPIHVQDLLEEYVPRFVELINDVSENIKLTRRNEKLV